MPLNRVATTGIAFVVVGLAGLVAAFTRIAGDGAGRYVGPWCFIIVGLVAGLIGVVRD